MKVALVHDDLVQWGGAERVLAGISEIFPEAPIYTSLFDQNNPHLRKAFGDKRIVTSFLQKVPGWRNFYKAFFALYPIAFEQFDFSEYDLVISHTTRFAKSIITKPETFHICYCHTPPRFLWNFSGEKLPAVLKPILSMLRIYDQVTSKRVDYFLAGSKNAQKRIKNVYQLDSQVLEPFVDTPKIQSFDGGYYLVIARLNFYKRVDLAVKLFSQKEYQDKKLVVIGTGAEKKNLQKMATKNVIFLGQVSEDLLFSYLSGARALIVTGEEDFGLTPLEAQAFGKPVIAYGVGGARETIIENQTGLFFTEQTVESLKLAVDHLDKISFNSGVCIENAKRFSKDIFQSNLKRQVQRLANGSLDV